MTMHGPVSAAALEAMDGETFAKLVRDSISPQIPQAVWDALTEPAVIFRTKNCLGALHADVLTQIQQANADLDAIRAECWQMGDAGRQRFAEARTEQADWRSRNAGFRRLVQRRMSFVKERAAVLAAANRAASPPSAPGAGKPARKHNRAALEQLARAVAGHQRKVTSGEGGEDDDDDLWESLETVTAINRYGEEMPLAQWLDYLDGARERDGGED